MISVFRLDPFPIQTHQRRRAFGNQRAALQRDRHFAVGQRFAQVHDAGVGEDVAVTDGFEEIDALFDSRGKLVGQDQRHQRVRGGRISQRVYRAAVQGRRLQQFLTKGQFHLRPACPCVEQFNAHKSQKRDPRRGYF